MLHDPFFRSILQVIFIIVAFLLPLLPSILLYRIFPKGKVFVRGSFGGLEIKAVGAFGGYVFLLIILMTFVQPVVNQIPVVNYDRSLIFRPVFVNLQGQSIPNPGYALNAQNFTISVVPPSLQLNSYGAEQLIAEFKNVALSDLLLQVATFDELYQANLPIVPVASQEKRIDLGQVTLKEIPRVNNGMNIIKALPIEPARPKPTATEYLGAEQ